LVTGCTGFLGLAVTRELLGHGAVVAGLVRERRRAAEFAQEISEGRFYVVHGYVEDAIRLHTAMALHEVSAVFHLATADALGNDRGTASVRRAAILYHSKVPVVVARPFAGLRLMADEVESPVLMGIARFGEVFGPGDRKQSGVVPRTIAALLRGEQPSAEDGPSRDFICVHDAARACICVAETVGIEQSPQDTTFRSGWQHTDREMMDLVKAAFGGEQLADREPEPPANPLGWQPTTSLGDSLAETIAWHRATQRESDALQVRERKAA
jgi:nucleoside-diphosphate-sugar epimerase